MSDFPQEPAWLPGWAAGVALASGVSYLATAYSVSRWLTRPAFGVPQQTPSDLGLKWEPLECRTADAIRLVGWLVQPPLPRATIAIFHGVRHNRAQTLERIRFLVAAGYRCVAFDHRAHGESGGKRTSFGYAESRDVAAVIELIRRRWPNQPQMALGLSMGGAALCFAAEHASKLRGIVLESVYTDIATAFAARLGNHYPAWFRHFSRGVMWVTERRLGVPIADLAPVRNIGKLAPAPLLILTGTNDIHASPADAQRLYDAAASSRELYLVPAAGHKDVCAIGGEAYRQRILQFFERCVSGRCSVANVG